MQLLANDFGQISGKADEYNLYSELDKGIDAMEAGNELPLEEAFQKISELREHRRRARV